MSPTWTVGGTGRGSRGRAEGSVLLISSGSGNDFFDDGRLGVGVVLDVIPPTGSQLTFGALIQLKLIGSGAQPITEEQHSLHLGAPDGEYMHLYLRVVVVQEPMLVPVGLPKLESVSGGRQIR